MTAVACAAAVVGLAWLSRWLAFVPVRAATEHSDARRWTARASTALFAPLAAGRRQRELDLAWAAIADEIAATLRAGTSLQQALTSVSTRGGVAAFVLHDLLDPVGRGQPLAVGAAAWARRASSPDEALLAEAVQLSAWTGRPEPALFDAVADSARERRAMAGELHAQTAQARASAMVLVVLPIGFTLLVTMNDRGASHFLLGTVGGWTCAAIGLGLDVIGAWWMRSAISRVAP
jgi:tight adherence protein B